MMGRFCRKHIKNRSEDELELELHRCLELMRIAAPNSPSYDQHFRRVEEVQRELNRRSSCIERHAFSHASDLLTGFD